MIEGVTAPGTTPMPTEPQKLKKAATDFEALLIGQMLKGQREEGGGWMGTGADEASGSTMALAEEQLARSLAQSGGLGLGRMILASVKPTASTPASLDPNLRSGTGQPTPARTAALPPVR